MRLTLLTIFIFFNLTFSFSQSKIYLDLQDRLVDRAVFDAPVVAQVVTANAYVKEGLKQVGNACYFKLDKSVCSAIVATKPKVIRLQIPYGTEGKQFTLLLYEKNILTPNCVVETSDGRKLKPGKAAFYRGIIEGEPHSLAGISFYPDNMSGIISSDTEGMYDLGKMTDKDCITVYDAKTLGFQPNMDCHTVDTPDNDTDQNSLETRDNGDCVRVWFDADYELYQNKGGVNQTEDYITGFFNNTSIIYDNESINTMIGHFYIWTTPDPFPTDNSNNVLNAYTNLRTDLQGDADLAHLVGLGGNGLGGIAWLNVLCGNNHFHAYSDIDPNYNNFPNYSWTVEVVTHEMGHNIGSQHTHWCGWNGGAIDNCYTPEGNCQPGPPPSNGGTIMSYCHLTSYGINFNNGFGPQPGDKIRSKVQNASCLAPCPNTCPDFTMTGTVTNVTCFGANNGKIVADQPTEGVAPYTYDWSNGMTGQTITGLGPGIYTVTITDSQSCSDSTSFTVTQPTQINYSKSQGDVACNGGNDGYASVAVTGGTPGYTYIWSNGNTSNYNGNLSAGVYLVTITDANGCQVSTSFTITQPPKLQINKEIKDVSCFGFSDGYIHTTAEGGVGFIEYLWSDGSNGSDLDDLPSGTYGLTITDGNGCSLAESYTVDEPSLLVLDLETTDVSQHGGHDGKATANVSGGTPGYTYTWSNGKSTKTIDSLTAGTYFVTVTDFNGCSLEQEFEIHEPGCNLSAQMSKSDVHCFGFNDGSATATPDHQNGTVTYTWSNGGTTQTISSLAPGTYTVTIQDDDCSIVKSTTIAEPDVLTLSISSQSSNCNQNTGSATANVSGGKPDYTYLWNTGATSQTISGLGAGDFTVTVTDANGCTNISTVEIDVVDNQPPVANSNYTPIVIELGPNGTFDLNTLDPSLFFSDDCGLADVVFTDPILNCTNVNAEVNRNGTATDQSGNSKTSSFGFIVKDNSKPTMICPDDIHQGLCQGPVVWPDVLASDNCGINKLQQTAGLPKGSLFPIGNTTVTYEATDNNGNVSTCSFIVTITEGLVVQGTKKNISCNGFHDGTASVDTSNIHAPYNILWSTGDTTVTITGLAAGAYTAIVTDGSGCKDTLTVLIAEPARLDLSIDTVRNSSGPDIADGSIDITPEGGTAPYTFTWKKDDVIISHEEDIDSLLPGTYELTMIDKNGCTLVGAEIVVKSKTSANGKADSQAFAIFPNPARDVVLIEANEEVMAQMKVDVWDIFGRKLTLPQDSSPVSKRFDTSRLQNGTFIFKITLGNKSIIRKIIIQK